MAGFDLLVDNLDGRLLAAITDKRGVYSLYIDNATNQPQPDIWGSIFLGKVAKVDTKLDAAIVDLGSGLTGILPAKHALQQTTAPTDTRASIGSLLKPGQMILVQIKSEAKKGSLHEQAKLPRLSMKIHVMGQYLIYCPMASRVTLSRQMTNEKIISATARLKGRGGWLVQSAADRADEDALLQEAEQLKSQWEKIHTAHDQNTTQPRLLFQGPNALARALIDYSSLAFDHIYVGDKDILKLMQDWCMRHDPDLATSKRLRLFKPEKIGQTLLDAQDVHSCLDTLHDSRVFLPSGGSIIIDQTHALVVIDVNQGSCPGHLQANLEAAPVIAREMRLRNLSGAILVDFINMTKRTERAQVLDALTAALADDPALALVHGFTRIGIVEMTRKRRCGMHSEKQRVSLQKNA